MIIIFIPLGTPMISTGYSVNLFMEPLGYKLRVTFSLRVTNLGGFSFSAGHPPPALPHFRRKYPLPLCLLPKSKTRLQRQGYILFQLAEITGVFYSAKGYKSTCSTRVSPANCVNPAIFSHQAHWVTKSGLHFSPTL